MNDVTDRVSTRVLYKPHTYLLISETVTPQYPCAEETTTTEEEEKEKNQ